MYGAYPYQFPIPLPYIGKGRASYESRPYYASYESPKGRGSNYDPFHDKITKAVSTDEFCSELHGPECTSNVSDTSELKEPIKRDISFDSFEENEDRFLESAEPLLNHVETPFNATIKPTIDEDETKYPLERKNEEDSTHLSGVISDDRARFQNELAILYNMGFHDTDILIPLLQRHISPKEPFKGHKQNPYDTARLEAVVRELLKFRIANG
jgi:hypothetical protein